jgi:hypothetical protein
MPRSTAVLNSCAVKPCVAPRQVLTSLDATTRANGSFDIYVGPDAVSVGTTKGGCGGSKGGPPSG